MTGNQAGHGKAVYRPANVVATMEVPASHQDNLSSADEVVFRGCGSTFPVIESDEDVE